jgi:hypothetical protein
MAAGSTPRGQDSPDDRDTLAAALEERSRQLDARLRETRCLFEVSASLGDYGLSCAQAAQVVAVCLPMAFERPEIVQIRVALDDGHAGDDMPAAGWHLSQPVQREGVRIALHRSCLLRSRRRAARRTSARSQPVAGAGTGAFTLVRTPDCGRSAALQRGESIVVT